jgi:UDP-N-acetylglucosamine 2-epimerase (non-hydrolysing)
MTTSIGAFFARLGFAQLAHIEAGMRSGNWRNPFPEELSRRFVAKLSHVNYAPGEIASQNLKSSKGLTINTHFNTVVDALEIARAKSSNNKSRNFGLVSLHRSELYESEFKLTEIISALSEHSVSHPLIFIDHPVTAQKITEYGLDELLSTGNIERIPKLNYWSFISLLGEASYVVTDSGGLQQECSITGQPCLVHRLVTESFEGVGENILLSELDINVVKSFLASTETFECDGLKPSVSPTSIILEDFASRGLITQPGNWVT